jgi:hypothetical protein
MAESDLTQPQFQNLARQINPRAVRDRNGMVI